MAKTELKVVDFGEFQKLADEYRASANTNVARGIAEQEQYNRLLAAGHAMMNKERVDEMMRGQGKLSGFLSDQTYGPDVVVNAFLDAAIEYGLGLVHNRINIIKRKAYVTQAGFWHLCHRIEGFSHCRIQCVKTEVIEQGWVHMTMQADWKLKGKDQSITHKVHVQRHKDTGFDALEGKAKRKILRVIFEMLTGSTVGPDMEVGDVVPGEGTVVDEKPAIGGPQYGGLASDGRTMFDSPQKPQEK